MHDIVLESIGLHHRFGPKRVLHDVNLKIARGQIVGMVGPSGCGKSTFLRAIVGTHLPTEGRVEVNGQPIRGPGRDRGIVYQHYTLYPFLTAVENVAFGLKLDQTHPASRLLRFWRWRRLRKAHLAEAAAMLEKFGLGHALGAYPNQMSGGMAQRVAVAQALIMRPQILLLDEPFGALDEATRGEFQVLLLELYQENLCAKREGRQPPYTILIVTHELNEALYVSDRVIGLSQHWRWEAAGLPAPPGATIVYDAVAPVFAPDERPDFNQLAAQRQEIHKAVFDTVFRTPPHENVRFWQQVERGEGTGVMRPAAPVASTSP